MDGSVNQSSQPVQTPQGSPPDSVSDAISQEYTPPELDQTKVEGKKASGTLFIVLVVGLIIVGGALAYYVGSGMGKRPAEKFMGSQQTVQPSQNPADAQINQEMLEIESKLDEVNKMQNSIDQGINDQQVDLSE